MERKFDERLVILALLFAGVALAAFMLGSKTAASACIDERRAERTG